jgi:hypothetical protein
MVATDPTISFKTCHMVLDDSHRQTSHLATMSSLENGHHLLLTLQLVESPGYGVITNIINGGLECGIGEDSRVADRIGFYKRYCDLLGVSYGDNLDCYNQKAFCLS